MGHFEIAKPFESYVSVEVLPRTDNARRFQLRIMFEVEGTLNSRELTWPWAYSGSQESTDHNHGIDGVRERCLREMDLFRRHIEYELGVQNSRVYTKAGTDVLIWATSS